MTKHIDVDTVKIILLTTCLFVLIFIADDVERASKALDHIDSVLQAGLGRGK